MKLFPWQQDAAKNNNQSAYAKFSESSWQSAMKCSLRGQLDFTSREGPIRGGTSLGNRQALLYRYTRLLDYFLGSAVVRAQVALQSPVVFFLSICLAIASSGLDK